jgi:transposase
MTIAAKDRLMEAFVQGVPAYRHRDEGDACADTRERFYRLGRACCAHTEEVSPATICIARCPPTAYGAARRRMRGWAEADRVLLVRMVECEGSVRLLPIPRDSAEETIQWMREQTAVGGIYCMPNCHAVASLRVHNGYIVNGRDSNWRDGGNAPATTLLEAFWEHARQSLQLLRKIPCKFSHLYLGEMCFRFNHRHEDLVAVLTQVMQSVCVTELRPMLGARTDATREPLRLAMHRHGTGAATLQEAP